MLLSLVLGGCVALVDINDDADSDGLSDAEEIEAGTDPALEDSDEDGFSDGDEIDQHTDPTDSLSKPYDICRDSITGTGNAVGDVAEDFELTSQWETGVRLYNYCDHVVWLVFAAFW